MRTLFMVNREARLVPMNYEHPKDERGDFIPGLPPAEWPEGTTLGIQMFETTPEGTPLSAVFPNNDEGRRLLSETMALDRRGTTADFEAADWLRIIEGDVLAIDIHSGVVV